MPIEGFFYLQCWWWLILQHANSLVAQIRSAKCPSAPDVSFLLLAADLASGKVTNALTQQFPSVWNPKVMPELPQPWCKALKAAVPYSKQDLFQPPETQQWLGGTTVFPTKKEKKETSEHVAFRGMLLQWRMAAWLLSAAPGPVSETPLCPGTPRGWLLPSSCNKAPLGWPLPSRSAWQARLFSSAISCWLLDQRKLAPLGANFLSRKGKIAEIFFREHLYCRLRAWHLPLPAITRLAWKCQDYMKKTCADFW